VKDIRPGSGSYGYVFGSNPSNLTNVNGTLFFSAYDNTSGGELWRSDGTDAGTELVKDIKTGANSYGYIYGSNPTELIHVNGVLLFTAVDTDGGRELWKSDGTESGTVMETCVEPCVMALRSEPPPLTRPGNSPEKRALRSATTGFDIQYSSKPGRCEFGNISRSLSLRFSRD
jgi:ELWxxDGT repeat protein